MCGVIRTFWNDANKFKIAGQKEVRADYIDRVPAATALYRHSATALSATRCVECFVFRSGDWNVEINKTADYKMAAWF